MLSSFVSLHYVYGLILYYKYQDGKWLGWGNEDQLVVPLSQMNITHHQSAAQGQWQCERQIWIDHTRSLGIVGPIVQLN